MEPRLKDCLNAIPGPRRESGAISPHQISLAGRGHLAPSVPIQNCRLENQIERFNCNMQIFIRTRSIEITEEMRELIARRLQFALDTFKDRIECVSVHVADVNGPRSGVDKSCRITASVQGLGNILVRSSGSAVLTAVTLATRRLKYRVSEALRQAQHPASESIRRIPAAA